VRVNYGGGKKEVRWGKRHRSSGQKNSLNVRLLDAGLEGTKTQVLSGYCIARGLMQTDTLPFRRTSELWGMELYERTTS
jgi:hypothetical protein